MSQETSVPADAQEFTLEGLSRAPLQGRSKASLERMLATARELMLERGSEDFTLQEVSSRGKVSIGSIYLRFENKDSLVRAVLLQATQNLAREENAMHAALAASCANLAEFVPRYVEAYSEVLRVNAPLLRLTMMRAEQDPQISALGKQAALRAVDKAVAAFMTYRDEFGGADPELAASSAHHIIFATLARQLSLGSSSESVTNYDWNVLKGELARMCAAYFQAP
ncbi:MULTISPECIES: TetR/AcrR family transcriptional regulator [unclassified Novosphingobium]|uniref:TetR/AcrR family transcriptional regulator n=1 Tax=Novosphingobium TaxID=165696 RepID=UPI0014454BC2|nr:MULTISPECIES: TetR/AcrR family transcriptional regulator [unclassified Novosphingobium]NKJ44158.1 AcrR family transcriptional regulator [Novosphingobium sp. SG720]NMN04932.1 AcrR family transcriptional regulator [Novosphingobium sp. SG919]NMN87225.1 AcrR family transcriptional regulator [Novosphingobium sp. SG916]